MDNNSIHENIESQSHVIEDHETQSQALFLNSVENQGIYVLFYFFNCFSCKNHVFCDFYLD